MSFSESKVFREIHSVGFSEFNIKPSATVLHPLEDKIALVDRADDSVKLIHLREERIIWTYKLPEHDYRIEKKIAFNEDGTNIAVTIVNNIIILNGNTGQKRTTLEGHEEYVYHIAYTPDGTKLCSYAPDNVRVWCTETDQELARFEYEDGTDARSNCAISSDSNYIAYSVSNDDSDCYIYIWDLHTFQQKKVIKLDEYGTAFWLDFNLDGTKLLIYISSFLNIIDIESGREIFERDFNMLRYCFFSKDDKYAICYDDYFLKVINLETGVEVEKIDIGFRFNRDNVLVHGFHWRSNREDVVVSTNTTQYNNRRFEAVDHQYKLLKFDPTSVAEPSKSEKLSATFKTVNRKPYNIMLADYDSLSKKEGQYEMIFQTQHSSYSIPVEEVQNQVKQWNNTKYDCKGGKEEYFYTRSIGIQPDGLIPKKIMNKAFKEYKEYYSKEVHRPLVFQLKKVSTIERIHSSDRRSECDRVVNLPVFHLKKVIARQKIKSSKFNSLRSVSKSKTAKKKMNLIGIHKEAKKKKRKCPNGSKRDNKSGKCKDRDGNIVNSLTSKSTKTKKKKKESTPSKITYRKKAMSL